jgi:alkanesulfonate monooxygenase SsuD/methylene tetrahydromethanopterin reductase-like flavin-dependent oxidoreductase (luciferase family)
MKVYSGMDPRLPLRDVAGYARRIEQLGFDGLHVAETIHDSLAVALLALEHTTAMAVRTSITLAFVRSPTLVAYTAWDLAVMSGGRFELGLGSQIKQNIRDRYGMPWSEPRSRMRDYLGALEALFTAFRTGGPLDFRGPSYQLTRLQPYFNPGPDDGVAPPPVWLGAVNAGMCELAGELASGVVTRSPPRNSDSMPSRSSMVEICGPPPCTTTGWMPTYFSTAMSRAKPLLRCGSVIAWPPYLMTNVAPWKRRM